MSVDTSITLRSDLPEKAKNQIAEAGLGQMNVGDMFIDSRNGHIFKINEIRTDENGEITHISYSQSKNWYGTKWDEYTYGSKNSAEEFQRDFEYSSYMWIPDNDVKGFLDKALAVISGEAKISDYADKSSDVINSETAIMSKNDKNALLAMQDELNKKKNTAELIARFVNLEMEKRKRDLERIKEQMYGVVKDMKKKVEKIMKVILTIELYLGINETITCICDGAKADVNTPITFRQAVLYMDEEIGHWEKGGLDYNDIEWFDKWLVEEDHYKKLLPEEKGMVVFRPRRFAKDYGGDAYRNAMANQPNLNHTYILIRNGECLYRIFTEKIVILPRLFPLRKELQTMFDDMLKAQQESSWEHRKEEKKEAFEDSMYQYKKRAALMQGLIDRSEVFHPLPCKINIFNLEETKELVNFVYDDEATLPSGRMTFEEWKNSINESITHGSRVMLTGDYSSWGYTYASDEMKERLFYYTNSTPRKPEQGIYDVELVTEKIREWIDEDEYAKYKDSVLEIKATRDDRKTRNWREIGDAHPNKKPPRIPIVEYDAIWNKPHLRILYNPKDTVYGGWSADFDPHERKKRIGFKIYPDDSFVLHYDRISLDDINFYLESRIDRPNYLEMMPVLVKMKSFMEEESKKEAPFIQMITGSLMSKLPGMTVDEISARVTRCVEWWKWKNKIKRPLDKNDQLAIRMIEKRACSKNYEKLKWEE